MSIYIDRRYLLQISSGLRNFKQKNENLFNFSCPFCGDSKKNTRKARGYVYANQDSYIFKCHNCVHTTNMVGLLKHINPALYSQYALETFNNRNIITSRAPKITKTTSMFNDNNTLPLEPISGLPRGHWVLDYVMQRKLPERFWSRLYYAPDYREFVDHFYPENSKNLPQDDPRLVIPFYNEHKILVGFQGRALKNFEIRYITIRVVEDDMKAYGMDLVDPNETIYVLEGPIDSMFLPNAIAVGDSHLTRACTFLPKKNLVLIYDNQYYHKEVRKLLDGAITGGFRVCIFPKDIQEKDLNDMILKRFTTDELKSIVDNNIFSGLRAQLELQNR